MGEQKQESEWILNCQWSLRLEWGCMKDLCCHLFLFAVVMSIVTELA